MFKQTRHWHLLFIFVSGSLISNAAYADDAIPYGKAVTDPIIKSGLTVELEFFAEMPATSDSELRTRINAMTSLSDGRLFVNDLRGKLYEVSDGTPRLYMDYAALVPELYHEEGLGTGLGSVAFHPEFDSNGKFYTTHVERFDPSATKEEIPDFLKRNWSTGVVSEWTANQPKAEAFQGKRREMLRVALPSTVHGLQHVAFNPNSRRGEPDYGMLYITLGEAGSMQMDRNEHLRNLSSPLGCILRIDPLGTGSSIGDYGIPPDNPWADNDDPNALGEIWSMGMRNPHRISWDTGGTGRMIFGDIGEMRIEEINIGEPGRDYGWPIREGVYRFDSATRHLVYNLAEEERKNEPDLTYPVAQYDHTEGYAISGGGVYRGKELPHLFGKYVFGDIASGRLFYVNESDLNFGSLAPVYEFFVSLNGKITSLAGMLGGGRVDLRLGWDSAGELYLFEKSKGRIYKAVSTESAEDVESITLGSIDRQLIDHKVKADPKQAIKAIGENPLIDDMEDGDLDILRIEGRNGSWFRLGFQDNGGQSFQVVEDKNARGKGTRVLQMNGGGRSAGDAMVLQSLVSNVDSDAPLHYDAGIYDGIQFWVKANRSGRLQLVINTAYTVPLSRGGLCDGESYQCDAGYRCRISVSEGWTLVKAPFALFEQSGYPNDGPLDPSILKEIGFSLRSRSASEFWIDDISFYKDE